MSLVKETIKIKSITLSNRIVMPPMATSKAEDPVILTGGVNEVKEAEQLLQDGKADLIGVGRAILKDSDWANKAMKEIAE